MISNLISDQTANNPAALEAQAAATPGDGYLYQSQIFVLNPDFDPTLPVDLSNPMFCWSLSIQRSIRPCRKISATCATCRTMWRSNRP